MNVAFRPIESSWLAGRDCFIRIDDSRSFRDAIVYLKRHRPIILSRTKFYLLDKKDRDQTRGKLSAAHATQP